MDLPFLSTPLTTAEIAQKLDEHGLVSGLVGVFVGDIIDRELETFYDLMSESLIGSILGMQIDVEPVHVNSDGRIILRVTVDPSMHLDDVAADAGDAP